MYYHGFRLCCCLTLMGRVTNRPSTGVIEGRLCAEMFRSELPKRGPSQWHWCYAPAHWNRWSTVRLLISDYQICTVINSSESISSSRSCRICCWWNSAGKCTHCWLVPSLTMVLDVRGWELAIQFDKPSLLCVALLCLFSTDERKRFRSLAR